MQFKLSNPISLRSILILSFRLYLGFVLEIFYQNLVRISHALDACHIVKETLVYKVFIDSTLKFKDYE
jgi:hypothetical protein